jgi:hypothetical protein
MANFCSQCGRPLNEGEVCNCTAKQQNIPFQQVQPVQQENTQQENMQLNETIDKIATGTKSLLGKIVPIFKNPVEELKNIAKTNSAALGLQMIVINLVITCIMMIVAMIVLRVRLGRGAEYLSIPYAGIVIGVTLTAAASYFLWAVILFGVSKAFAKNQEITVAQLITISGGKALYDIVIKVVGILLFLLLPGLGVVVLGIGSAFTSVLMIVTYCETVELEGSKKVYAVTITYICVLIVTSLIMLITLGSAVSEVLQGFGSAFGDFI